MTLGDDIRRGIWCAVTHLDVTMQAIEDEPRALQFEQIERTAVLLGSARAALIEARETIGSEPRRRGR